MILFGHKGVGKSYFGSLLAKELALNFVDTDRLVEFLYFKKTGLTCSCRQIYRSQGEQLFRSLEHEVVSLLPHPNQSLVAVGGGTLLSAQNYQCLSKFSPFVWLRAPPDLIKQRVVRCGVPPFLAEDFDCSFDKMYAEREVVFSQIPSISVFLDEKNDERVVDELIFLFQAKKAEKQCVNGVFSKEI